MDNKTVIEFYKRTIFKSNFKDNIIEDLEELENIVLYSMDQLDMKSSYNNENLIKILFDSKSFTNGFYDNKDYKYIKSSLKAILLSIELLKIDLNTIIGNPDRIIVTRLIQDSGIIFEYCFEGLKLRESGDINQKFYFSMYKGVELLYSLNSLKFILCENEDTKISNPININSKILYMSFDIRKQMELFFWEYLTGGKELIRKNGNYYKANEIFFTAVEEGHIKVNNQFLKKAYNFLGSVIHKKRVPEIYVILFILKTLVDEYFDFGVESNTDFRGRIVIKNDMRQHSLKEFVSKY